MPLNYGLDLIKEMLLAKPQLLRNPVFANLIIEKKMYLRMEMYQGITQKKFNDQTSDITPFLLRADITQYISG